MAKSLFSALRKAVDPTESASEGPSDRPSYRPEGGLEDCEKRGIASAEETVYQGERLDHMESALDRIGLSAEASERHIENIKGFFGGIKSWLSGEEGKEEKEDGELNIAPVEGQQQTHAGPSARTGVVATTGSYSSETGYGTKEDNTAGRPDDKSRLKGLARGMGGEIQRQNEQLDRISDRVEKTNIALINQNKRMRRLLEK